MFSEETKSLIHLNLMQGVGSKTVRKLVEVFDNAENALKASSEEIEYELRKVGVVAPAGLITRLLHYPLEKELEFISKHECHIITLFDKHYPTHLKYISTPPPVLYVKGKLKPEDIKSIAIVGPRKACSYGKQFSHKLSCALAEEGVSVVSGLAKGIDTCAHRGALEAGGRTLAIMAGGLSGIYPPENKELAEEVTQSGALISEFPMNIRHESKNFHQRNRIISGLTLGTVVIEACRKSGALSTAKYANEQRRKVFAVPNQVNPERSSGCQMLIKGGAQRVDKVSDFLNAFPQLCALKITDKSENYVAEQLPLPFILEPPFDYLYNDQKIHNEEKVKSEVIRYFQHNYPKFDIKLEHEIQINNKNDRADVALINSKQRVAALVECKRHNHVDSGIEQLDSYMNASNDTHYGFFANSPERELWVFYKKTYNQKLKEITHSEFEKGVLLTSTQN